jgi:hypothetical protein
MFVHLYIVEPGCNTDNCIEDIRHYDARSAPTGTTRLKTYGTSGLGLDLTAEACGQSSNNYFARNAETVPSSYPEGLNARTCRL